MNIPRIRSYGKYSDNYGTHCLRAEFDNFTIWQSYNTIVAFRGGGYPLTVRENEWGPTTGKHLNAIDGGDKKGRVSGERFHYLLQQALENVGLSERD